MKNKSEVFKKELENIKDNNVKESTIYLLNKLPDYFYEMPASTTGKYHPPSFLKAVSLLSVHLNGNTGLF